METGVVAPDGGVGIDGKDGGEDLGKQKKKQGQVERSANDLDAALEDPADAEGGEDNSGEEIDKKKLVELEDLGGFWPKNEGSKEKQGSEEVGKELVEVGDQRMTHERYSRPGETD